MQTIRKRFGLALPTLVLALTALVSVPAFAQQGSNEQGGNSGQNATQTGRHDERETENETEFHHRGAQLVAELKQSHKHGKTAEERTKACESHKQGLQTKFSRITANSQRLETKIGVFQTRAAAYQADHSVTVSGWDALVADATAAKSKADDSITAMKALTPSLDCTNSSVATEVATFKAAAVQVRSDLKDYKTAVKNLFVALQNAKGGDSNAAEGSDR